MKILKKTKDVVVINWGYINDEIQEYNFKFLGYYVRFDGYSNLEIGGPRANERRYSLKGIKFDKHGDYTETEYFVFLDDLVKNSNKPKRWLLRAFEKAKEAL